MSLVLKWAPAWCSPIEEANVLLGKSASLVLARKSASGLYSVVISILAPQMQLFIVEPRSSD